MKLKRIPISIIAFFALIIAVIGCGGGGASFATPDKAAVFANSVAGHQALQGGLNVGFVTLERTAPGGSGLGMNTKLAQALFNSKRPKLQKDVAKPQANVLDYLPFLGLYFSTNTVANVMTISYFNDSSGTSQAGTMTITMVGQSTFDTNYSTYPQTIQASANVTGGKIPMTGSLTLTYLDSAGANTMVGNLTLPTNNITININLALSHAQTSSGSATITTPDSTFTFSNVTGNPFGTMNGSVAIAPQNWTGTGTMTPSSGLFTMVLNTPQGQANAVLGLDGKLVITYPDGTGNTVNDPSSSSLELPGGGTTGTTSTTATTATTSTTSTTSTTATTAGTFADPVELVKSSGSYEFVMATAISANGKIAGYEELNNVRQPVLWNSATSVVELQKPSGTASVTLYSMNNNGAMVGEWSSPSVSRQPIYYLDSTAAPITLKMPQNTFSGVANAVNASGMVVGYYFDGGGKHACYWTNKDADPAILPAGSIGGTQEARFVDTSGAVYGVSGNKWVKWATTSTNPVEMTPFNGSTQAYMVSVTPGGVAAGGYLNIGGNGSHPAFWASGSTSQTTVDFVTGFSDATMEAADGNGNGSGFQRSSSNVVTAWVKLGSTSRTLQELVSNAGGWTFYDAKFMDSNGNVVCQSFKNNKSSWVYLHKQ